MNEGRRERESEVSDDTPPESTPIKHLDTRRPNATSSSLTNISYFTVFASLLPRCSAAFLSLSIFLQGSLPSATTYLKQLPLLIDWNAACAYSTRPTLGRIPSGYLLDFQSP